MLSLEIAITAACLTLFLNYCIGKPGGDHFSPYEIFASYTVWLSIRRLQQIGLYDQYIMQYNASVKMANTKHEIITLNHDFKRMLYSAADPFFTWERMAGMCPVCTGFWVSLGVGLAFTFNFVALVQIIVFSHVIIRILNKII